MKQEVSPFIIAIAAIVVVAIVGFIAYKTLTPSTAVPTANTKITPPPAVSRETFYQNGGMGSLPGNNQSGYNSSYGRQGMGGGAPR